MGQYKYRIRYSDGHVTPWADWNTTPAMELQNKTGGRARGKQEPVPIAGKAIRVEYELPLRPPSVTA